VRGALDDGRWEVKKKGGGVGGGGEGRRPGSPTRPHPSHRQPHRHPATLCRRLGEPRPEQDIDLIPDDPSRRDRTPGLG
jgi:hypothetical protein